MRRIRPGEPFQLGTTEFREGTHFNFTISGRSLILSISNPDSSTIDEIEHGEVVLGISIRDQALFVLSKFGRIPWRVAHFNWWINPPIMRPDPIEEVETIEDIAPIAVVLINADNGIVLRVRSVQPPGEFNRRLLYEMHAQIRAPFDPWQYLDVVEKALESRSEKGLLIKDAVCICTCDWPTEGHGLFHRAFG